MVLLFLFFLFNTVFRDLDNSAIFTTEKLVSSWYSDKSLPQDYVFPPDKRPGKDHAAAPCNTIPVIDLEKEDGDDRNEIILQILDASQDFGFFQVLNHGVSERLMDDTMNLFLEFFDMPDEDEAELYSEDRRTKCRLFTSSDYANEEFHFWRDNLRHPCIPLEECINLWPTKPARYRDIVGAYSVEVRNMLLQILELMREGLALQSNTFGEELTKEQMLSVNHYPPCPEPSLTLGLPKHCDPNLMTAVHQGDIPGLQVLKDGKWVGAEALPNAFVVSVGHQLQIITNGKFKSAEHRALTNSSHARTTVATFLTPDSHSIIEPARALADNKPPLYRAFKFEEFISLYIEKFGDAEAILEPFKLQT